MATGPIARTVLGERLVLSDALNGAIGIVTPIDVKVGKAPKAGLMASDLFTNQFLDPTIKMP